MKIIIILDDTELPKVPPTDLKVDLKYHKIWIVFSVIKSKKR